MDHDKDGKLSQTDIERFMPNLDDVDDICKAMHADSYGRVSFEDFYSAVKNFGRTRAGSLTPNRERKASDSLDNRLSRWTSSMLHDVRNEENGDERFFGKRVSDTKDDESIASPKPGPMSLNIDFSYMEDGSITNRFSKPPSMMENSVLATTELEDVERGRLYCSMDPEDQLEELRQKVQELQHENEQLTTRCHGLLTVGQQLEKDNDDLHSTVSRLEEQLEEADSTHLDLNARIMQLNERLEALRIAKDTASSSINSDNSNWAGNVPRKVEYKNSSDATAEKDQTERSKLERQFKLSQAMLARRQTKMLQDLKASRKRWVARTIRLAAWMMKKKQRMETTEPFEGRWANSPNLRDEIGSGGLEKRKLQLQVRTSATSFKTGGKESKITRPEIKGSLKIDTTSQKHARKVSPVDMFVEKVLHKRMAEKQRQSEIAVDLHFQKNIAHTNPQIGVNMILIILI